MNNNIGLVAVGCVGALTLAYLADFYPVYVAIGAIGLLLYTAFAGKGEKPRRASRPSYLDD
jgi:hypothetical protein